MNVCMSYPCRRTVAGCPICDTYLRLPPQPTFAPLGCICPPTSEQTCQNQICPRKPLSGVAYNKATGEVKP